MAALSVLKTFDPPITSLQGRNVTGADRFGKHLALDCDGLWLIAHLSRGGWLRWIDNPVRRRRNPARGRWRCACTSSPPTARPPPSTSPRPAPRSGSRCGGDGPAARPGNRATRAGRARGDPPTVRRDPRRHTTSRIKTALVDQSLLAGIGNAYSDEILHAARLSPFATTSKLGARRGGPVVRRDARGAVRRRRTFGGGRRRPGSRARSAPGIRCTRGPGCRARCAATRCGRWRTPSGRSSTARRARPVAGSSPTGGCHGC